MTAYNNAMLNPPVMQVGNFLYQWKLEHCHPSIIWLYSVCGAVLHMKPHMLFKL